MAEDLEEIKSSKLDEEDFLETPDYKYDLPRSKSILH